MWFRLHGDNHSVELNIGDRIRVETFEGKAGNVVSRLPDGRMILFGRNHPYNKLVGPDQEVEVQVVKLHSNYVIVEALEEGTPIGFSGLKETPGIGDESYIEELEKTSEAGYGDTAIIARALLHIIKLQSLIIKKINELASKA